MTKGLRSRCIWKHIEALRARFGVLLGYLGCLQQNPEASHPVARLGNEARHKPIESAIEKRSIRAVGGFQRAEEEPRPFALHEVAADGLAEGPGLGGQVEEVVLDLEGTPESVTRLAERHSLVVTRAPDQCAEVKRQFQQGAGLAVDHVEVGVRRHVAARLEGEIQRLPFAEPGDGRVEGAQCITEAGGLGLSQEVRREREEQVARKNRRRFVPLRMNRRASPAGGRRVHDVVVDERERVKHLDRKRGGKRAPAGVSTAKRLGGEKKHRGPHTFPFPLERKANGGVQFSGLLGQGEGRKACLHLSDGSEQVVGGGDHND